MFGIYKFLSSAIHIFRQSNPGSKLCIGEFQCERVGTQHIYGTRCIHQMHCRCNWCLSPPKQGKAGNPGGVQPTIYTAVPSPVSCYIYYSLLYLLYLTSCYVAVHTTNPSHWQYLVLHIIILHTALLHTYAAIPSHWQSCQSIQ